MPRTIKEIKAFVSQNDRKLEPGRDPAGNNVVQNLQLLKNELSLLLLIYNENIQIQQAADSIIKAVCEAEDEDAAEIELENLGGFFNSLANSLNRQVSKKNITAETRDRVLSLMGYISAGLNLETEIPVTEAQRNAAGKKEEEGRLAVQREVERLLNDETKAVPGERRNNPQAKNALELLNELKAQADALPKTVNDPKLSGRMMAMSEAERLEEMKKNAVNLCIRIVSTRRAVRSERNNKALLGRAFVDEETRNKWENAMKNNKFKDFLEQLPYSKLISLAAAGHGGKLEDQFKAYVKSLDQIPASIPKYYMPSAKERIEILQDKMGKAEFSRPNNGALRMAFYRELLATRAAVHAVKSAKASLEPKINAADLERERQKLMGDPLKTALERAAVRQNGEEALPKACYGHGGRLEKMVQAEIRAMGIEAQSGFALPITDSRYAPTYRERAQDILAVLTRQENLTMNQRLSLTMEYLTLSGAGDQEKRIEDCAAVREEVQKRSAQLMNTAEPQRIREICASLTQGLPALTQAVENLKNQHPGQFRAVEQLYELKHNLKDAEGAEELKRVAAGYTVVRSALDRFAEDRDQQALQNALSGKGMTKAVKETLSKEEFRQRFGQMEAENLRNSCTELKNNCELRMEQVKQPQLQNEIILQ